MMYRPAEFVIACDDVFLSRFVIETAAPGTIAPLESVTCPATLARNSCANAVPEIDNTASAKLRYCTFPSPCPIGSAGKLYRQRTRTSSGDEPLLDLLAPQQRLQARLLGSG